jgi:hypothetical protein
MIMSDVYVGHDRGRVLIFTRDPELVSAANGFEIRPWDELYSQEAWHRFGNEAGFGCYMVRTRRDMLRLVTDHYCTKLTTPEERASSVADVEDRAAAFGLKYGDNWEPIFAGWGTPNFKQIPV